MAMFVAGSVSVCSSTKLHLFGDPFISVDGERVTIPDCGAHLLVWLALRRGRVDRTYAAGVLWPAVDDRRAAGNLRSALWRLRRAGLDVVETSGTSIALRADISVDVHSAADWAQRLIEGTFHADDLTVVPWFADAVVLLAAWHDDWLVLERERLRHRTMHAFEELSRLLCSTGRFAEAVEAARILVDAEPLRESAQRALSQAYRASGDTAASGRAWEAYRRLHRSKFGVDPRPQAPWHGETVRGRAEHITASVTQP